MFGERIVVRYTRGMTTFYPTRSPTVALLVVALVCVFGVQRPASANPANDVPLAELLERTFVRETLGEFWGSICVTRGGRVVWSTGVGYADTSMSRITANDALFDVGSIAKSFTAVAMLRLIDNKKATLDTPLDAVFEGVPVDKSGITLEQLLNHTSGIPARFQMERSDTAANMLASLWDDALVTDPGEAFAYSNANYFIAAAAIERLAREPFEDAMHRLVIGPAGLTHTGLLAPESARPAEGVSTARRATRGRRNSGTPTFGPLEQYPWNWGQRGATGVISSARDLCRWADLLASGGLLSPASHDALFTPREGGYALGWYAEPGEDGAADKPARFSHSGSTGGYRSSLIHHTATNTSVAVLSHSGGDVTGIAERLMDAAAPPRAKPTIATVFLAAYPDDPDGVYEINNGLAWRIMPEYRSSEGTDKRPTVVITDVGNRFWPVIVRMDRDKARSLADDARAAIEAVARDERARTAPWRGGMTLCIDTRGHTLSKTRHLPLGENPRVEIRVEGLQVLLELTPADAEQPVASVRLGGAEATELIQGLRTNAN